MHNNVIKKYILIAFLCKVTFFSLQAQERVSLAECYAFATQNFPLIKQKNLLENANQLQIKNLNSNFLPQVELNGQATYQSDVTALNLKLPFPNIELPTPPSRDQYRVTLDVKQLIYDGGLTQKSKLVQSAATETEQQKVNVELFKLREKVNQLYFAILQADEQARLVELMKADLQPRLKKIAAGIQNGVAIPMNLHQLEAELLKVEQRLIEISAMRSAAIEMLNQLINKRLSAQTVLEKPNVPIAEQVLRGGTEGGMSRPEIALFDAQKNMLLQQEALIAARNLPKVTAFATGGYGRPALNMLLNDFQFYAIGGIAVKWNLSEKLSQKDKNDRQLLQIQKNSIDIQRDILLLNINMQAQQFYADIEKLGKLIESDKKIIALRTKIKNTAATQLDNGISTANDFIIEANAENQARQNLILHELQLVYNKIQLQALFNQ